MAREDDVWLDEAAGPLVRPYAMTRGRTRPTSPELDMVTQVVTARRGTTDRSGLSVEHLDILELCKRPLSIAEVASYLDVPLVVGKVLVGDLIERGDLIAGSASSRTAEMPNRKLLQAVLDGVRRL
ncbi:DUF742 domain-containing protein [Saccharopolyspora erythraea]|uniref:DUF742 domain-containing protein n=1 Tax=Saccharopolyspora erythraea TaxID=1836 RepID=UPI001BACC5CF|nr:DUF742 domain-containing protein [Saccharopolyspora erythraea]QUH05952.1 DUF742 domain-containing protein [Saccharopolyspora erythraea]